jgi:hypothetical protein
MIRMPRGQPIERFANRAAERVNGGRLAGIRAGKAAADVEDAEIHQFRGASAIDERAAIVYRVDVSSRSQAL